LSASAVERFNEFLLLADKSGLLITEFDLDFGVLFGSSVISISELDLGVDEAEFRGEDSLLRIVELGEGGFSTLGELLIETDGI
jgi:hypothetical protein